MNLLLVTYELRGPNQMQRRTAIAQTISTSPAWWHHLESTWLILTNDSPEELTEQLSPHLGDSDHLLIVGVDRNITQSGLLPQHAWDWLEHHSNQ